MTFYQLAEQTPASVARGASGSPRDRNRRAEDDARDRRSLPAQNQKSAHHALARIAVVIVINKSSSTGQRETTSQGGPRPVRRTAAEQRIQSIKCCLPKKATASSSPSNSPLTSSSSPSSQHNGAPSGDFVIELAATLQLGLAADVMRDGDPVSRAGSRHTEPQQLGLAPRVRTRLPPGSCMRPAATSVATLRLHCSLVLLPTSRETATQSRPCRLTVLLSLSSSTLRHESWACLPPG